jgi:arsenite/tail-anchored protein-transporting ATPase
MNTQYIFFSGKGGVGKSSMAAATAVHFAEKGLSTLLVSTDPAGNLGDIFEREISTDIVRIGQKLDVVQLDADKITEAYKRRMLEPLEEILDGAALEAVKEQFNGGCTVEIATFDRFTDFLSETAYRYIIFDTAPTGHTLRLMTLPGEWNDYIAKSEQGSGQTCIGPVSQIQDAREKYAHAVTVMQDPAQSTVFLVARPEKTSVYEAKRAAAELEKTGIRHFELIINGIIPAEAAPSVIFSQLRQRQQPFVEALLGLGMAAIQVPLQAGEIKGYPTLRRFAAIVYDQAGGTIAADYPDSETFAGFADPQGLLQLIRREKEKRILAFTGKGGVGKTVAACAMAQQCARDGKTLLLTTDPAAHIGQTLQVEVGHQARKIGSNLWATNIEQRLAGEEYKAKILADARRQDYSAELMASLAEELESPCTEEIAVFEKFAHYLTDDQWEFIVIDTAPTGHTLRLFELPFDYQQQISMKAAPEQQQETEQSATIKRVISLLKDPAFTRFFLVVYPEYTPLHESARTAQDLERVGIAIAGVLVNQVLREADCVGAFAQARWKMQQHYLHLAQQLFAQPLFAMPLLEDEIIGQSRIDKLRSAILEGPTGKSPLSPGAASTIFSSITKMKS